MVIGLSLQYLSALSGISIILLRKRERELVTYFQFDLAVVCLLARCVSS